MGIASNGSRECSGWPYYSGSVVVARETVCEVAVLVMDAFAGAAGDAVGARK